MRRISARFGRFFLAYILLYTICITPRATLAQADIADCNGDGQVSAADAAALARAMTGTPSERAAALTRYDLTQNGVLNSVDVRVLLSMAAGKIENLVAFVERNATGLLDETEFDRFSYTGVQKTENSYVSSSVSVTVEKHEEALLTYFVADIWVRELSSFRTALYNDHSSRKYQYVADMAKENDAIIAVNGDFFKARGDGPIVRNGVFLRTSYRKRYDQCVMTYDGVIKTYQAGTFSTAQLQKIKPYQVWLFGPRLLDDSGGAIKTFKSSVAGRNPRTAIGYYEPGHYCLVLVEGRQEGYSSGLSLKDLSALFFDLGCKAAYNLDGGETSAMATADGPVSHPYRDGRVLSDIIYVGEPLEG